MERIAPEMPSFWEYAAAPSWRSIDLISDLHLAADTPRTFDACAKHLRHTSADAVLILGDLFEVWVGDDSRSEGFERQCVEMLAEASAHRSIGFMVGNRDFLVGAAMLADCGMIALPDPTVLIAFGRRYLLSHGDALCLADVEYQRFRAEVRRPSWRTEFLALPLAVRRAHARRLRDASEQRQAMSPRHDWPDIDAATAVQWMHGCGTPTLIHGHTHQPGSEPLAPGHVRHVLSDWDLDHSTPGPARAEVLRLNASGLMRLAPESAVTID